MTERLDADAFFTGEPPGTEARLEGEALARVYWRARALREEGERKERYWSQICDALGAAYADLERTLDELADARAQLAQVNAELERRLDEQAAELATRTVKLEGLRRHLSTRVEERAAELLARARAGTGPTTGTLLRGRTHVLEPLGQGGGGAVYHARDDLLGDDLAIKVLRRPDDPAAVARFLGEASAAARVDHPAVVHPLHLDLSEDGAPYLVMERVAGRSLRAQLASAGALPAGAACRLLAVLAHALAVAHRDGLVHRDIKPGNLMITAAPPGLRILDFGLARVLAAGADDRRTARLVGTPAYASPEQVTSPATAGPPSDIYAAGATLFEACAGRPPFTAPSLDQLIRAHLTERPPALDAPGDLADLVAACLAKHPDERPTAATLATTLDALADRLGALPAPREAALLLAPHGDETSQ